MGAKQIASAARHRNEARHRGSGRCWATPPELFAELNAEFRFTLDPCATEKTAKCDRYFTEATDGLKQDWGGVVLSGYPSDLYEELYAGWRRVEMKAHADGARDRTEVLWINERADRAAQGRLL